MTDYGVLPNNAGFRRKPLEVILQEINDYQLANVSPTLDLSPESPQGQLNSSVARQIDRLWGIAEIAYHGLDPDRAEAMLLQTLAKLTHTARRGASHSTVACDCSLAEGTTLIAGVHFANVAGNPDSRWTPLQNFTAPSVGTYSVLFRSEERGPIAAAENTITVINTSLTGWTGVTNPLAATVGRNIDDDEMLRARREADVAQTGSGTAQAIRADVNDVENVESVTVFENKTDYVDANGLPPHSVEVIVDDGNPAAGNDDEIAQAIFNTTGPGIAWHSSTGDSGTAVDQDGAEHVVPFTRVRFLTVHLAYTLAATDEYPGDAPFQNFVVEEATKLFPDIGTEVVALRLQALPLRFAGIADVTSFAIDTVYPPVATDNIEVGARRKAWFNTSNIDVSIA